VLNIEQEQTPTVHDLSSYRRARRVTVSQFRQSWPSSRQPAARNRHERGAFVELGGPGRADRGIRVHRESVRRCRGLQSPRLVRTLRTTGFDRIVVMTETVDEAKKTLRTSRRGRQARLLAPRWSATSANPSRSYTSRAMNGTRYRVASGSAW